MALPPPRRTAWLLLLAALALPGWALAHALVHEHLAHHHAEGAHRHGDAPHRHAEAPTPSRETEGPGLLPEERAHEHGHLDAVLLPASRSQEAPPPVALPVASPEPPTAATFTVQVARERAPPRAGSESTHPTHPRAPPQA